MRKRQGIKNPTHEEEEEDDDAQNNKGKKSNFALVRIRRFQKLNWFTPYTKLPHGVFGLTSIIIGLYLVLRALTGTLHEIDSQGVYKEKAPQKILVLTYLITTALNAVGGFILSPTAPKLAVSLFRLTSMLQITLVWFATRFYLIPEYPDLLIDGTVISIIDKIFSVSIVIIILTIAISTILSMYPIFGFAMAMSVWIGCFSLLLLSGYPLQLGFSNKDWYNCVMQAYPLQRIGFVFYVYIPATFTFSAMLFGATLFARKIISGLFFGVVFGGIILGILFSTVLLQELHIPFVSTQKLVLFCPPLPNHGPEVNPISIFLDKLDTSLLAQTILRYFGLIQ